MKSIIRLTTIIILTALSFSLSAQNRITRTLEPFNAIKVSGRIDLELIYSESNEMSLTSRNIQPEEIIVEQEDGFLKIKIKTKFSKENQVTIKLPYQEITRIEATAGAVINSARDLETKHLELKAHSGGKIELSVKTKSIDAKITQVSDIILYGSTNSQNVSVNTGGNYSAYELECKESYVTCNSGSQAKVRAKKLIDAHASSKGYIGYIGNPPTSYTKTAMGGEIKAFNSIPEE